MTGDDALRKAVAEVLADFSAKMRAIGDRCRLLQDALPVLVGGEQKDPNAHLVLGPTKVQ